MVNGEQRELSYPAQLALYRGAQEALTNIHKHSQATKVEITLHFDANCTRLTVENDGVLVGTAPVQANPEEAGFGLIGLRERVNLLDGKLEASPRPGGGFYLNLEIPNHEPSNPAPDRR